MECHNVETKNILPDQLSCYELASIVLETALFVFSYRLATAQGEI
jgi:hypothetical protein